MTIDVRDEDAELSLMPALESNATKLKEGYNNKQTATVNTDAKITVTVATTGQAPVSAVNYQVKGGSAQSAEYNAETKKWEFEVKATDDVDVDVVKSTDKKVVLTVVGGDELTADEDGVYSVSYKDEIVAKVYNGETPLELYSTNIKTEAGKNAKTAAVIDKTDSSQSAKIKVVEAEYGETLTVSRVTLGNRQPVSFQLRTETTIDGVTYENDKIEDGKIVLPVDTETEVKINMSATTLNGVNIENGAELVNGAFTIQAVAQATGKKNNSAAKVVLYDVNDTKKTILAGSEILVNTADATVFEKVPALTPGTPSAKAIQINISFPEGVEENLVAGDV